MRRATGVSFAIALALVSGASFSPFTPVTAQEAEDVPPSPIAWLAPYATETATEDVREVQKWIDAAPEKPAGKDTGRFQTTDLTIGEATLFVLRSADPDRGLEEQKSTIEATRVELARSEDGVASADIIWLEMHPVVDGTTSEARTAGTGSGPYSTQISGFERTTDTVVLSRCHRDGRVRVWVRHDPEGHAQKRTPRLKERVKRSRR